ncbi:MAG TPA: hypothetical protein VEI97_01480, partial [bacterium]|nr:hypothetical protein [bacterium]
MDPYIEQLRQWLELRLEVVAPGRYEFREFLAAGGLGAVYRYHDRSSLDIDVAVKVIDPEKLSTVSADQQVMILRRFTNEARVDAYLRKRGVHVHPVVYLHDAQASPAFMITDLLHGPTFEQRMQVLRSPGQPLEVDKIVGALAALAPSLAAIHKVG